MQFTQINMSVTYLSCCVVSLFLRGVHHIVQLFGPTQPAQIGFTWASSHKVQTKQQKAGCLIPPLQATKHCYTACIK